MTNGAVGNFDGLGMHLGNLWRLSDARSRSISAENPRGEKSGGARATEGLGAKAARDLGPGWKVSPALRMHAGATTELADIEGPGAIQQILVGHRPQSALAVHHSSHLLGRPGAALGRMPDRRLLRLRLARVRPDLFARRVRQPDDRVVLLLGDAVPPACPNNRREHRYRRARDLLPGQLHSDNRSR